MNKLWTGIFLSMAGTLLASEKPNVLLIVGDDHGYADFSYKKIHKNVRTPNLDKLKNESVEFKQAYSTSPISSPSRASILTGKSAAKVGNYWFGCAGVKSNQKTIPEYLKELDYETCYIGKHHYGYNMQRNKPENHGFEESFVTPHGGRTNYLYHSKAAVERYGEAAAHPDRMGVYPMLRNGEPEDYEGFTTEKFTEEAISFINKNANKKFFCQLAYNAIHNFAWQLPDKYLKEQGLPKYDDWDPKKEAYVTWYHKSITPSLPNGREYYLAQLYYMDKEIGNLISNLKKSGLYDKTMIIYISDNGGSTCNYGNNGDLRGTKYTLYEGGIKVPLFVKFPKGEFAGKSYDGLVSAVDLLPTIVNEGGGLVNNVEGNSLRDYLTEKKESHNILVWDNKFQYAIRQGDWKLKVINNQIEADKIGNYEHTNLGQGVELFNIKLDPNEKNNLAEQNSKLVKDLTKTYKLWKLGLTK